MIQIADKWTIIDIYKENISEDALHYITSQECIYKDLETSENIYSVSILEVQEETAVLKGEAFQQIQEIDKLAEENDAFYFRIIYT